MSTTAKETRTFPVVETFGPTIQGEGLYIGQPVAFIRFGYCTYRCVWCDSKFAVEPEQVRQEAEWLGSEGIVDRVSAVAGGVDWLVFSGGNPAIHALDGVVEELHEHGWKVMVETQGDIRRTWLDLADHITVSPKPPSSGNVTTTSVLQRFLFSPTPLVPVAAKMVVFDEPDFEYAREVNEWLKSNRPDTPTFLSVGNNMGKDGRDDLLDRCAWIESRVLNTPGMGNVRVLPQLHVLLHGNSRGV